MESKELLRSLAQMAPENYTKTDRDTIRELSKSMGVTFKPRRGCPNCYHDQAVLLWSKLRADEAAKTSPCNYKLKPGLDFIYRGQRINQNTLTNEIAEELLSEGFPAILIEKK